MQETLTARKQLQTKNEQNDQIIQRFLQIAMQSLRQRP